MSQRFQIHVQIDDEYLVLFDGTDGLTQNTLSAAALATLGAHDLDNGTVTIVVTSNDEIQRFNHSFLGIDEPTDVLSFPAHEHSHSEHSHSIHSSDEASPVLNTLLDLPAELAHQQATYLGDLLIALPYTRNQAARHLRPLREELSLLVVHGTLHLLGYDHLTADEEREMWTTQADILAKLGMVVPVESHADE